MIHKIVLSKNFYQLLTKIDRLEALLILLWMKKHLHLSTYPVILGQALTTKSPNFWRYRVGHYRIITKLQDQQIIALALEKGYRKNVALNEEDNHKVQPTHG